MTTGNPDEVALYPTGRHRLRVNVEATDCESCSVSTRNYCGASALRASIEGCDYYHDTDHTDQSDLVPQFEWNEYDLMHSNLGPPASGHGWMPPLD